MEKNDIKLISILLAIVIVAGLIPAQAFATVSDALPIVTAGEEFTAAIDTGGGAACFRFTPEEDGLYTFESFSDADTCGYVCDAYGNTIASDVYSGEGLNFAVTLPLTKGLTYTLKAMYNGSSTTGSYTAKISRTDTVKVAADSDVPQATHSTQFYTFTAEEGGAYALYASGSADIYVYQDSYWASCSSWYECWNTEDAFFDATAGETVYLKVKTYGAEATVGVTEALPIESVTYDGSEPIQRYYIPSSSECYDVYANITPAHADVRNITWSIEDSSLAEIWVNEPIHCSFVCLGVGETYLIASDGETELARIPAVFENCPALTLNEPVTTTFTGDIYYNFTPEVSGTYSFSISQTNLRVNLSSGNDLGGYGWNNANGDGYALSIDLEAGETYCLKLSGSIWEETTCTFAVTGASGVSSITADLTDIRGIYADQYRSSCYIHLTYDPADADTSDVEMSVLDPSVAEIRCLNVKTVSITALGVGTTELVITAGGAELRIPITYEAPTPLVLNTPVTVYSENTDDVTIFQFTPERSGSYTFYVSDSDNLARVELIDPEGNLVDYIYDYSGSTENRNAICVEIEAGETYVLVASTGDDWNSATFNVGVSADLAVKSITSDTTALNFPCVPEFSNFSRVEISVGPENADATSVQWEILDSSVAVLDGSDHTHRLVYPVGVGETELVISAGNGVELRIPITVTAPGQLVPGNAHWADTQNGKQWYVFTPAETGEYIIYSNAVETWPFVQLYAFDENGSLTRVDQEYQNSNFYLRNELQAGATYYYAIDYWYTGTEESEMEFYFIQPCELTNIAVNTDPISGYVGTEATALDIVTTPQYADMSSVTVESTDPEVVTVTYEPGVWYYTLVSEGTAQITVTWGNEVYTIDVEAKTIPALELDVPVSTVSENYEDVRMFTFTPEADGDYTFYLTVTTGAAVMYLENSHGTVLGEGRAGEYYASEDLYATLEAGQTYTLLIYCDSSNCAASYAVTVMEALAIERITSVDSQINMTWVPGQAPCYYYIYLDVTPAHAVADTLCYTVLDTSVAELYLDYNGYYCVSPVGIGETELVISAGNGVELRIPIIVSAPASDVLYGDVNQDGSVDNMDATLVLQYAAGWDVVLADAVVADVNCDGSVDNMDATLILQFAAGWDVILGTRE